MIDIEAVADHEIDAVVGGDLSGDYAQTSTDMFSLSAAASLLGMEPLAAGFAAAGVIDWAFSEYYRS